MGAWDSIKDAGSWINNHFGPGTFTPGGWLGSKLFGSTQADKDEAKRKELLQEQAAKAGTFADYGEGGVVSLGGQMDTARQQLQDIASGKLSYSKEALRQGLMQNQAAQRSMAAGAAPQNAAMAARTAAINNARMGSGLSGQSALAGIAEQQGAAKLYGDLTAQQRQQDLMAALQSRQTATTGYGANNAGQPAPDPTTKMMQTALSVLPLVASDRRLKTDVRPADQDARDRLEALQAYAYRYKQPNVFGRGPQLGVMAQDLERAGLGQAVVDTPRGKTVDSAKLTGANTAMLAALGKRVRELEEESPAARLTRIANQRSVRR